MSSLILRIRAGEFTGFLRFFSTYPGIVISNIHHRAATVLAKGISRVNPFLMSQSPIKDEEISLSR